MYGSLLAGRNGPINTERLRCKYRYKQAIKDAALEPPLEFRPHGPRG